MRLMSEKLCLMKACCFCNNGKSNMRKTIQTLFDEFLYEREYLQKVRPDTIRGYSGAVKLFHRLMPAVTLENISPATIIGFFKVLEVRKRFVGKGTLKIGIKKSTVATYWSKLNAFLGWLKEKGYIRSNPFDALQYPTPMYEDKKFLKKEEVEKIITAIHTQHDNDILVLKRNLALFYLLLFCGLRREEIIMLQVRDFDFERKLLTIRSETSKSGRTRQIPLHSTCIMYAKDYLHTRKTYTTPYFIVSSTRDERLTYHGLKHIVQKLSQASGIPFHLHQFRHTFAVNFLKTSNNVAKLRQLLGHKSITMTLAYLRCLPVNELRGDIETMSIDNLI
jgi:integrase